MPTALRRYVYLLTCVTTLAACSCSSTVSKFSPFSDSSLSVKTPGAADFDAPEQFTETISGLKYKILRQGTGRKPAASDTVLAHYAGWLDDGTEFDSSYKRGKPTDFPLNGVIPGWTEGLQLVGEGGMIELEIPSEMGYGQKGMPGSIPPNATLHFKVELIEVM